MQRQHIDEYHLNSEMSQKQKISNQDSDKEISIANLILVHRFPMQFQRTFNALYHSNNHYLIHVDQKADSSVLAETEAFISTFPNAHMLKSEKVVWGGYSMVQSELDGMKLLLSLDLNWDFFINLSGQDFPLKPQSYIHSFLAENRENSFMKIANQTTERPETMNRIDNYFEENSEGFPVAIHKREFLKDVTPYIGGQWLILTRSCCEFICWNSEVKVFEDYYRNTLIADESFFQTVLMNSSFAGNLINDDKRAIVWIPDGTIKLRPKTFTGVDLAFLNSGNNLFARKFDENVDTDILFILEETMSSDQYTAPLHPTEYFRRSAAVPRIQGTVNTLPSKDLNKLFPRRSSELLTLKNDKHLSLQTDELREQKSLNEDEFILQTKLDSFRF